MTIVTLAGAALVDEHPVLVWTGLVIFLLFGFYSLSRVCTMLGKGVEEIVRDTGKEIKESDWYKSRQERKEIEALERKLKKKRLQTLIDDDKLDNT